MAAIPALAPALITNPPPISPSPVPGPTGSITSKEWVVPPRPKPGRKPATDTPPTKRKAQNRAAQRAFRERRAARVNELEDQIKEIEDEHDLEVSKLSSQIKTLSQELDQAKTETAWWRARCHSLEKELASRRQPKESENSGTIGTVSDAVPLPPRSTSRRSRITRTVQTTGQCTSTTSDTPQQEGGGEVVLGCINCSTSHCQCIEDAFNIHNISIPSEASPPKRLRLDDSGKSNRSSDSKSVKFEPEEMEIDFTSRFTTSQPQAGVTASVSSAAVDPCGFCQDGTPCICAEMANQEPPRRQNQDPRDQNRLAPIHNLSQFTPPPSESDVRSETTLPPISQATNPCANGPGTCAQCRADPRSTLFCKTLAASQSKNVTAVGCCGGGGKGADGGCCQSRSSTRNERVNGSASTATTEINTTRTRNAVQKSPLTLSCADTFTTLSRHPNFTRASDELGTWLPKLHTLPNPRDLARNSVRPAMEVEAASVMGVLRYFDRRFADN